MARRRRSCCSSSSRFSYTLSRGVCRDVVCHRGAVNLCGWRRRTAKAYSRKRLYTDNVQVQAWRHRRCVGFSVWRWLRMHACVWRWKGRHAPVSRNRQAACMRRRMSARCATGIDMRQHTRNPRGMPRRRHSRTRSGSVGHNGPLCSTCTAAARAVPARSAMQPHPPQQAHV